ncbi:MAG: serine/threonine-protein kinase [Gemmataceae bacterium]
MPSAVMPPPASAPPTTGRADERILRVLDEQGFGESDRDLLVGIWTTRAKPEEKLAEFLVRVEILDPAAPQVLAMNWGESLLISGRDDLFRPDGLAKLRQMIGPVKPAAPAESPRAHSEPISTFHTETPATRKPFVVPHGEKKGSSGRLVAPAATELANGQLVGRCLITGRLAQGSYGTVYRAIHRTLNIPVAIKVLHPDLLNSESRAAAQFRTEAMLLARLNHTNIVRVWDFDDTVSPPYIVLEYVEGANVAEMIQRRGFVRLDLAIRVILQVIDGLEAAYQHGIVHRDVKPANILLGKDENAKIADLGLAVVADRHRELGHLAPHAGSPNAMAGTVAYLAPEQAGGPGTIDHRSDIYSLGATFYHMVTGQLPFTGRSPLEVLMKHARQPLKPPSELMPEFAQCVSDLIVRMMAKNPGERFRTYDELRDALIDVDIAVHSQAHGLSDDFRDPAAGPKSIPVQKPETPAKKKGLFGWLRGK